MRPTLRQLEYIVAVAETGRIGLAAERLNVSQPSLSSQISEVEADLGAKLFVRGRNGARITPIGEDIVRRARVILRDINDLRAVASGGAMFQGRLRLGVLPSIGPYLLPNVVRRLHHENPELRVIIREEATQDLDEGLRSGRLDMIISTPEDHPGGDATHLFSETLWAAMAPDHELASHAGPLRIDQLRGQTLLTLGSKHRITHIVAGLAARSGGRVSDEYEGTSLDAIRIMAASGAGIAILPSIYAATEARRSIDLCLRAIDSTDAGRDIALIQTLGPVQQQGSSGLVESLRKEATKILSAWT